MEQIPSKTHTGCHSLPSTPTPNIWSPVLAHCHCHQRLRWLRSPQTTLFTLSQLIRIYERDVKSHYSDNSRVCLTGGLLLKTWKSSVLNECLLVYMWQSQTGTRPCKTITGWWQGPAFHGDTGHDLEIPAQYHFPILAPNELALEEFSWMSIIWYIMSTSGKLKLSKKNLSPINFKASLQSKYRLSWLLGKNTYLYNEGIKTMYVTCLFTQCFTDICHLNTETSKARNTKHPKCIYSDADI